jgi:hypothetical protein
MNFAGAERSIWWMESLEYRSGNSFLYSNVVTDGDSSDAVHSFICYLQALSPRGVIEIIAKICGVKSSMNLTSRSKSQSFL